MRVGFIGIGNMGSPMASHIVKGGHAVTVYDTDADKVSRFASAHGCRGASTLADLGDSEIVITMLPDGHVVRSIMMGQTTGESGLARHLQRGTLFVDMSSSDPVGTRTRGAERAPLGITMLDAPGSGAVPRAITAKLAIMIGGDDEAAI